MRLVVAGLLALAALLAGAGPAAAHAQLVGTDPVDGAVLDRAPVALTLSFNEPVRLTDRETTVYDAEGATVAAAARTSGSDVVVDLPDRATMTDGTYVVAWFVLSTDGHPISGSLTFSVGERSDVVAEPPPAASSSSAVTAAQGVLGFAQYAGLLVAVGLAVFATLVLPGAFPGDRVRGRIRRLVGAAAYVAVAAAVLLVPVRAAYAQGEELTGLGAGFDLSLVADELVSVLALAAGLVLLLVANAEAHPGPRRRAARLAGATAAVASPALAGHTRSYEPTALLVVSDPIHLAAGAVWLGGLLGLVLTARALAGREQLAAETLARFSNLAGGLLLAVAGAGAVLGWRILNSWSGFVDTRYGVLLLVKIGLALVVAALGGWNRFAVLPRVRAAVGFGDRARSAGTITRTMAVEACLIGGLLGVTGFLVDASPRPVPVEVPAGRSGVAQQAVGDLEVYAGLTPRLPGRNTLLVQVQDETGEPVTTPRPPEVEVRSGNVDLGAVRLVDADAGTWTAEVLLPRPGTWEVQVALRLSRFDSPVSTLRVDVPATPEG